MFRVAAIGYQIADSFDENIRLDKESLIKVLLLHDMGNILKFNLEATRKLGVSDDEIEAIKITQQEYKLKYGTDDHIATEKIAEEIGVSEEVLKILKNMGSSKLEILTQLEFWEARIATYADNRVDPHGVVTLAKRWSDIAVRYKNINHPLSNPDVVENRMKSSFALEEVVQQKCKIDLQSINNSSTEEYISILQDIEI
ncbi:MAG: hypothetical protein U0525_03730 [Patescibacteria group bacterium]